MPAPPRHPRGSGDPPRGRLPRWLRIVLWAVTLAALLLLALWQGVPRLARWALEGRVAESLSRPVTVGEIRFNPLKLEMSLADLVIAGRGGGEPPLLAFDHAVLDVSIASVWHRAPVLDRVQVDRPRVALSRLDDGRYSVQDLIDKALAPSDDPPTRFSLNNIELTRGEIDFDDRPKGRKHEVRDLAVGIPFLSSLPYQTSVKVVPHVSARVNGSPFSLSGTTTPFAAVREASLDIDLDQIPIPQYLSYVPVKLRAKIPSGTLSSRARLMFSEGDPQSRTLWLSGEMSLANFRLQRPDGRDTLVVPQAKLHIARLDVLRRTLVIDSVAIERAALDVRRDAAGTLELSGPWVEPPAQAAPAQAAGGAAKEGGAPWQVDVEKVSLTGGTVRFDDASVKPAFRNAWQDVTVDATDLSTRQGKRARVQAKLAGEAGGKASAEIDLVPTTLEASGHVAVDKLALAKLQSYTAGVLNLEMQGGTLAIAGDFSYAPGERGGALTVSAGEAQFTDLKLALPGERTPLWRVPKLVLGGIAVDASARRIDFGTASSSGGELSIRRDKDGAFNFGRLVKSDAQTGKAADGDAKGGTWAFTARKLAFTRYKLNVDDDVPSPAVAHRLVDVDVEASDLTNARDKRAKVTFRGATAPGGRITGEGTLGTNPFAVDLALDASGLALPPLQPYVDPYLAVRINSGSVAARLKLSLAVPDGATAVRTRVGGNVTVTGFAALDTRLNEPLLRFGRLALEGLDVDPDAGKLDLGAVSLEDFFARVILYEDATLNYARLVKGREEGAGSDAAPGAAAGATSVTASGGASGATSSSAPVAARAGDAKRATVSIGTIKLARGSVRYTDLYVRPSYTADLSEVAGTVSPMSAAQAGTVDLAAKVERTAPVTVKGTLNPFAPTLALDLKGTARNVDLPPLSTYAVKYAGYGITKGTLSFDVSYKIDNRKLVADNRLVLDQLTFGEHVDSPTATKLPVLLAASLLKDAHGVIDLKLPISGSLDDPKFSVGGLIVQVIVNLITKAVTAPFALIGAAFGGGEELSTIAFEPGRATLDADAKDKVDKLAKALESRPALKLDVTGHADPAVDAEALRKARVEREIRAQKVKALVDAGTPPENPRTVTVSAEERPRFLEAAYKEAPIKDRPRNFFGMLKDVPPADMEAMLLAHAAADPAAIGELAQDRAQAVKQALVARGVGAERIFVVTAKADAAATRVDLALR